MAAIVGLFAVSCSKTSLNTTKIIGTWKAQAETMTYNGKTSTHQVEEDIFWTFKADGSYSTTEGSMYSGTWLITDDTLMLTVSEGSFSVTINFNIDKLDSKNLILSGTFEGTYEKLEFTRS